MKRKTRRRLIAVLILIFIVESAELAARAQAYPALAHLASPYWSDAFVREQTQVLSTVWAFSDNGYLYPRDFSGVYYNFKDGERRTVGQPTLAPTLYLLGNSALWDAEVPDEYTMASQLQALIGSRYRVINLGMTGANAALELARLQTLPLRTGDVVVFYDGYNDAWSAAKSMRQSLTACQSDIALVKIICSAIHPTPDPALVQVAAVAHDGAAERARHWTTAHGAVFYNVLQPVLWSKPLSAYEQAISDSPRYCLPGEGEIVMQVYAALHADANLLHVLDDYRAEGHEVFVTQSHVNERADGIIARAVYDILFPIF